MGLYILTKTDASDVSLSVEPAPGECLAEANAVNVGRVRETIYTIGAEQDEVL
jgi:hypothetical protein